MKVALVIFSTLEGAGNAAVYRALGTAKEFKDAGDDVKIVFDGSGVETAAAISQKDNGLNASYEAVKDTVLGACGFCVKAHKVSEQIEAANIPLLTENHGHASLRNLVVDGYQVITF